MSVTGPFVRSALSLFSPGGERARLSVLVFHRVIASPDRLIPEAMDQSRFDEVCRWVAAQFNVLPLDEAAERLRLGTLPPRAAAITFDDGYADNLEVAAPVLRRHRLSATVFVATAFLEGGMMWNDMVTEAARLSELPALDIADIVPVLSSPLPLGNHSERRIALEAVIAAVKYLAPDERLARVQAIVARSGARLPQQLMMNAEQVRALRCQGLLIGAHTVSHPILAGLPRDAARAEVLGSKHTLESLLGEPVTLFAYPNGKPGEDFVAESVEVVREAGFRAAVTTAWGAAHRGTDLLQLPRFTPWDRTAVRFAARMAGNLWRSRPGATTPLVSPHLRKQSQVTP